MTSRHAVLALAIGLLVSGLRVGAEEKASPEKAYLKALTGEWDASVKAMGSESKGSQSSKMVGELWVVADFKTEFGGQPFAGHSVTGYDANKKKFTGIWVDTLESGIMHTEGTLDKAGKVLTETGEGTMQGQKVKHKMVTELVDKDTITFKLFNNVDDKEAMMTITYKRKK